MKYYDWLMKLLQKSRPIPRNPIVPMTMALLFHFGVTLSEMLIRTYGVLSNVATKNDSRICSLIANHNLETGKLPSTKPKTAHKLFTEAARYYLLAAEAYPKDDEKHISKC